MRLRLCGLIPCLALATGCAGLGGPGIEYTAPRVRGRVVDASTGMPVANARVGRRLYVFRQPTGGFRKGGEELRLLASYARSGPDGEFELPAEKAVFLVRFGEVRPNLRLSVQRSGWHPWITNWPLSAIGGEGRDPLIEAGEIPMTAR